MSSLGHKMRARIAQKVDEVIAVHDDRSTVWKTADVAADISAWIRSQEDISKAYADFMAEAAVKDRVKQRKVSLQEELKLDTYSDVRNSLVLLGNGEVVRFGAAKLDHNRALLGNSRDNMYAVMDAHRTLERVLQPIIEAQERNRRLTTDDVMKRRGWVEPQEPMIPHEFRDPAVDEPDDVPDA